MSKFKVGDRVRIVKEKNRGPWNSNGRMDKWLGKVMTINKVDGNVYYMLEDAGESASGELRGWTWCEDMIEGLAVEQKIVITSNGKTTLARLYEGKKVVKSAEAKCSPEDTFDFRLGAKIALERLISPVVKVEESIIPSIEVGDTVKVINYGRCYTTYSKWFKQADVDIDIAARYKYSQVVANGTVGKVVAKHMHENGSTMVYCIEDRHKNVYLIGEDGIVKEDK